MMCENSIDFTSKFARLAKHVTDQDQAWIFGIPISEPPSLPSRNLQVCKTGQACNRPGSSLIFWNYHLGTSKFASISCLSINLDWSEPPTSMQLTDWPTLHQSSGSIFAGMAKHEWILSDPLISNTSTDLQSPYHNGPSVEKKSLSRSQERGQFWLHSHDLCDPSPWLWSAKTSMMWIVELTYCMGASPERPFSAKDQNKLEAKHNFSSLSNKGTEFIKRARSLLYWSCIEVVVDVVVAWVWNIGRLRKSKTKIK